MLKLTTAADLSRRDQSEAVMDAGQTLLNAREFWYPIMLQLQRFMVAVSRVAVNHDGKGGLKPGPYCLGQE